MLQPPKQATCDEFFANIEAPEGDFEIRGRFGSPSYPLWCTDCDTWHFVWYGMDVGRRNGYRFLEVWDCEAGNDTPSLVEAWSDRDGLEAYAKFIDRYLGETFQTLRARSWTMYYDWVLAHQKDPLGVAAGATSGTVLEAFLRSSHGARLTRRAAVH